MITIAEVIEQCRGIVKAECVGFANDDEQLDRIADAIRALKAQYEGCIVAEGSAATLLFQDEDGVNQIIFAESHPAVVEMLDAKPLYRAREAK